MPATEIVIDLSREEPFEWGALLTTIMAFPEREPPESLMESCFLSLCSLAIRGRVAIEPALVNQRLAMKPAYALHDSAFLDRDMRHVEKRLQHRMLAGKMCVPFLQEASTRMRLELPPGIERLFVSQMAEMVLEESGYSDAKHVVERIWYPSRPVIHFAAATTIVSSEYVRLGYGHLTIAQLVTDPNVVSSVVRVANDCIPLLAKSRRARVDTGSLIRVRLGA
jgi:hypothetical protein